MDGGVSRFGQVEFDAVRGRLSAAGRVVRLDRPCAAILAALVEQAGRDVDKDRLLEEGWPGRVVHENSLAKAIGRLRQALGEDGKALETVHGYGYRLAADVSTALPHQPDGQRAARRLARAAVLAGIVAFAIAASWWATRPEEPGSTQSGLIRGEPEDALGRVLWVDDNPGNNAAETRFLERRKIAVYEAISTEEALAMLAMYEYRAVISDMNRGDKPLAGLELVREMRRRGDSTPFYLYTVVPSVAQEGLLAEAGGQRAAVTPDELYAAVLPLFDERRAR